MSVCRAGDGNDLARGTRVKCPPTLLLLLRRAHFRSEATPPSSSPGAGVSDWARRAQEGRGRTFGSEGYRADAILPVSCHLYRRTHRTRRPRRRGLTIRAASPVAAAATPPEVSPSPQLSQSSQLRSNAGKPPRGTASHLAAWTLYRQPGAAASPAPHPASRTASAPPTSLDSEGALRGSSSARAHGPANPIGPGLHPTSASASSYI